MVSDKHSQTPSRIPSRTPSRIPSRIPSRTPSRIPSRIPSWTNVYVYTKIKEKAQFGEFIRPKVLLEQLKRIIRVPKTLHYPILKQMEEEGLIKRINHQKYQILQEANDPKLKEINDKLRKLEKVGTRNRMLKAMEECGLIKKDELLRFRILANDFDKKLELMGNYVFW